MNFNLFPFVQYLRFIIVSCINTIIGYGTIFFCMFVLNLNPFLSNNIGYSIGLIISYALHRHYTFNSLRKKAPEITKFLLCFSISYGINLGALYIFISSEISTGLSQLLAGAFYITISFMLNKFLVFKKNIPNIES